MHVPTYDSYGAPPPSPSPPPPQAPPPAPPPSNAAVPVAVIVGTSLPSVWALVLLFVLLLIARRLRNRAVATRTAASHGESRKMERLLDAMPQQSYRRCSCAICEENGGCTCRGCCGGAPHGKGELCSICLSQFESEPARLVRRTPCGHYFHAVCIDRWLLTEATCPLCKVAIGAWEVEAALAAAQAPPAGEDQVELEVRGEVTEVREDSDSVGERESDSVWDGHG